MSTYSVPLSTIMEHFQLEAVYMPTDPSQIDITVSDVNRPGLFLAGHHDYFEKSRIQIIGHLEHTYLDRMSEDDRNYSLKMLFGKKPVGVVFTRDEEIYPEAIECAQLYKVPLLVSKDATSNFISGLITYLNSELAPRITRHGVFVEVYGEGILLMGDSGVGKSETAIELVKRGHRLIADDAVELRKTTATTIVGSSPDNIRHFVELRGIGIINVRRIFGVGAVKNSEKVDMVINLEQWDSNKNYDRLGLDSESCEILGVNIPTVTIPVRPGRNLAIIIEVAAMNNRQKRMGYNAAKQLLTNLGMYSEEPTVQ